MRKKSDIYLIIVLYSIFFLSSMSIYQSLYGPGYMIFNDFTEVKDTTNLVQSEYLYLWNEKGGYSNIYHLSQLFMYSPLLLFFMLITSVANFHFIYASLLSALSGICMFLLISYLYDKKMENSNLIILASSIFYIFSTFPVEQSSHPSIRYAFYLAPLIFYTLIRGVNENKKIYLFFSVIIWSLAVSDMHWVVYGGLVFLLYIIYDAICEVKKRTNKIRIFQIFKGIIYNSVFVYGIFLLFNSYWIIPGLFSSGTSLYGNILTEEANQILFRNADMSNIVAMKGSFNLQSSYGQIPMFLSFLNGVNLNIFLIALTVIGLSSFVLIRKKSKEQIFFGFLFIIIVFLSAGPRFAPGVFNWFMFDAPLHSFYGWAFRTPKFHQFLILVLAPLIAFTGLKINDVIRQKDILGGKAFPVLFLILILVLALIPNYPLLTGDFNGKIRPTDIPQDYKDTVSYLNIEKEEFKAIWGIPYLGMNSNWHNQGIGDLTNDLSPMPTFSNNLFHNNLNCPVLFGTRFPYNSISYRNETRHLAKFYSPLNIKYILVHNDIPDLDSKTRVLLENLQNQKDISLVKKNGFVSIFKIKNPSSQISIKGMNIGLSGGLRKYNSFTYLEDIGIEDLGAFYSDYKGLQGIWDNSDILFLDEKLLMLGLDKMRLIEPFRETDQAKPDSFWSKEFITSVPFRNQLAARNIQDSYQFGYSKGMVFTWADSIITANSNPSESDLLKLFNFEENFDGWDIQGRPIHMMSMSDDAYMGEESLQLILKDSSWGWMTINSPLVPVIYGTPYRWIFHMKAENAHAVHAKISEYDTDKKVVLTKYIVGIGTGTFEWKEVTFDYKPTDKRTAYMQLQILHGHETTQPLPNKIWLDDVKIYDLTRYMEPVTLDMDVNVDKDGAYELFVRYFKNKDGGRIDISMDGQTVAKINTYDQLNKFVWENISTLNLKKGKHKLTLTNIDGFNAVNIFALIPEEGYRNMEKETESMLEGKRLIHILEAESDIYRDNAEISKKYGGEASNGEVLEFNKESKAWQTVSIMRTDNYTVALRLNGDFNLMVDDSQYRVFSDTSDFKYIGPLPLEKGEHRIEITLRTNNTNSSDLDVLWIYSTNNAGETLEDVFTVNETPATVEKYEKHNPTLYTVKVNSQKPFMLSFAESYDPLWYAEVTKINGEKAAQEKIRPIPLYSVINGFWIEETGDLEIKIEYEPQRWFYIGAVISLATLILSVIYLIKSRTGTPSKHLKPGKEDIRLPDISQHTKNITGAFRQILSRKGAEINNINARVTPTNKKEWKYKYKAPRKQKEIILDPRPGISEENIDRKIKEIKERLMKYEKMKKKTPSH